MTPLGIWIELSAENSMPIEMMDGCENLSSPEQ